MRCFTLLLPPGEIAIELHFEIAVKGLGEQILIDIWVRQRFDAAVLDGGGIAWRHLLVGSFQPA
jgi:hypothetical protein